MEPKAKSRHMEPISTTADEQCVDAAATATAPTVHVGHAANDALQMAFLMMGAQMTVMPAMHMPQ